MSRSLNDKMMQFTGERISDFVEMELLWKNMSPTSTFLPQNISIDAQSGDVLIITSRAYTSAPLTGTDLIPIGFTRMITAMAGSSGATTGGIYHGFRQVTTSDKSINFDAGYSGTTSLASNDGAGIPCEIYRLKGVKG